MFVAATLTLGAVEYMREDLRNKFFANPKDLDNIISA